MTRITAAGAAFRELSSSAPVLDGVIEQAGVPLLYANATRLAGVRADGGLAGGRWVAAASLTGQSHQASGTTAQDSYCFAEAADGSALVLAVCDGLGKHAHTSQVGAELLARLVCARAAEIRAEDIAAHGFGALVAAVVDANADLLACRDGQLPGWADAELHCTMALCLLPLSPDAGEALVVRVGDCEALLVRRSQWDAVYHNDAEGPANVVRAALPHADPAAVLEFGTFDPRAADVLVLATDGVAGDIFDSPGVRGWLAARWATPCGPVRMLDSLRYRAPGSHDDRTVLAVWLRPWESPDPVTEAIRRPDPTLQYPLDEFEG